MSSQTSPIIIRIAQFEKETGLSVSTAYRYEAAGILPPRRRFGPRCVGWLREDVMAALRKSKPVV